MEELINPSKFSQILSAKKKKNGAIIDLIDASLVSNTYEDMLQPINKY